MITVVSGIPDDISERMGQGSVIAYPTEAVFGLGCDPYNETAVMRLLALKQRPVSKGLILIAADFATLAPLIQDPNLAKEPDILASWPGPSTWVFPASQLAPKWITGDFATIAVRVTAHPLARALCQHLSIPLVSTSANIATRPPARDVATLQKEFPTGLDLIIEGPLGTLGQPTTIRDAMTKEVIR